MVTEPQLRTTQAAISMTDGAPIAWLKLAADPRVGKTTTLRCVAGLEQPDRGTIRVGEEIFFDAARGITVPMNLRRLAWCSSPMRSGRI
ncbi:MAG: hypothetical protein JOY90_12725 [Bradyrhizobium sp.]|uniref:hypothetical protein n=1 Tax=Bradyrhizobium sp. TaxID=376 RepID=UPI001E06A99E|nr:hypothetical protein [Bradyrhizobium sp.]MBV9561294.1 hypothetical protein [Bradyrhizobium sp.]